MQRISTASAAFAQPQHSASSQCHRPYPHRVRAAGQKYIIDFIQLYLNIICLYSSLLSMGNFKVTKIVPSDAFPACVIVCGAGWAAPVSAGLLLHLELVEAEVVGEALLAAAGLGRGAVVDMPPALSTQGQSALVHVTAVYPIELSTNLRAVSKCSALGTFLHVNPFKTNFSLTFSKKTEYIFLSYVSIEELFRK